VAKMLAKEPERRYQTPAEVAQVLTPFFKKGNVASTGSKPELSQAGRPYAKQATAGAGSVPTRPAAELQPAPEPSVRKPVETPRPEAMWKSLVDFTETEPVKKAAPTAALNRRPPWLWPAMAAGVLLLGLVVVSAVVLWVKTSKPTPELPKDDDADSTLTNSIRMTLKRIPAGTFQMGSPDGAGNEDERPQHEVRITRPFYLGVTEVSQAQYEAVMGNNPSYFSATGDSKDKVAGQSTGQHPVETVYWLDAVKFCNKLSELEGRKPFYEIAGETVRVPDWKASGYRLPTEAEWEQACGGDPADLEEHAWFDKNSGDVTHSVGKKLTNRFGLHDMLGNVAEWCWDAYDKDYYKQSPPDDPTGPDIAGAASRVFRGGSWLDDPRYCRSALRSRDAPVSRHYDLGFRLALYPSDKIKDLSGNMSPGIPLSRESKTAQPLGEEKLVSPQTEGPKPTPSGVQLNPALEPRGDLARDSESAASAGQRTADVASAGSATATAFKATASTPVTSPPISTAADSPEEQLKSRGLRRSGSYFVVASEGEALEKYQKIRPLVDQMAQAYGKYAQVIQNELLLTQAEEYRNQMSAQVNAANAALSGMPNGPKANSFEKQEHQAAQAMRDGLVQERNSSSAAVDALRRQQFPPERKGELAKDFSAKRTDFLKAEAELAKPIEKAKEEYRKLQGDSAVKDALAAIRRSTKTGAALGPSKNLQNVIDTIRKAERAYSPETNAPKKKRQEAKR